ncbi:hypothetical protein CLHUN_09620 [Ruminiclostridium hungatei]|uniref:Uncharacterized protein n=1 Tax=Ruminiclostridium hungatei TaxID=48256 RepID=A0A1V4SP59_RUMHU|nr:hypothetical protein CLHUN_09620 [Ruminiclostridium hungatei]
MHESPIQLTNIMKPLEGPVNSVGGMIEQVTGQGSRQCKHCRRKQEKGKELRPIKGKYRLCLQINII